MKILLLGANGQLGSEIRRYYTTYYDRVAIELYCLNRQALDISNLSSLKANLDSLKFDILINCTGYTQVDLAEKDQETAYLINAYAVEIMAQVCQLKQAKFIHISTDYVYGNTQAHQPLTEQIAPIPVNIYGSSKLLGERLAQSSCDNTLIFRSASLFGITPSRTKSNFIETILRLAYEKGIIKVINDQFMSPTGATDLACMIFQAIQIQAPAGIYHAVNTGQASWYEFASAIIQRAKIPCQLIPIHEREYPLPAKRPLYSVLDNSKLCNLIGPIPDWQDALKRYFKR
jgi:dTDP-4-dehydrorhamnose reductase